MVRHYVLIYSSYNAVISVDELNYKQMDNLRMPQELDLFDASEAIRRMQATYAMLSNDIAEGFLDGVQYTYVEEPFPPSSYLIYINPSSKLSPIDCLAMGRHLMNQSRWTIAEQWILAGIKAQDRKGPQTEMILLRGPTKAELFRTLGKVRFERSKFKKRQTMVLLGIHFC